MIAWLILAPGAHALEQTAGLRYRYLWVPGGIMDVFYFDSDVEGALPYARPKVKAHAFGIDWTLAPEPGGGPSYVLWLERVAFAMDEGYWDDRESVAEHIDGDWLAPDKGFGLVALGANYMHELALTDNTNDVWVSMVVGGGLGLGIKTGNITLWHPGPHPDVVDPLCGPLSVAPDRQGVCVDDGELNLPGVAPILDITIGTKVHVTEHASARLEVGLHDMLYFGVSAGGVF